MIRARLAVSALTTLLAAACAPSPDVGGLPGDGPDAGGDAPTGPDATPPDAPEPTVPPEVDGRLVINEVMTKNALTIEGGADWIELYNPTGEALSLHGYGITDDLTKPHKHVFGPDVVVPPGGHLLLVASDGELGFSLDRVAGELGLSRPDRSWIDRVTYGEQETDFSAARTPDGSDVWTIEWHPSPGAANRPGAGQPVGLEDLAAPPEAIPAAGDLSELVLGYDTIFEIDLSLTPTAIAALRAQPFEYVAGDLIVDGRTYGPVGIRLKGQNSFQTIDQKPSFRININEFDEEAELFGLKDLTLNNMTLDPSMMHERLAYRITRELGVPASRCNHAVVRVNGQLYGLYANVETVKRKMIGRWFADDQGSLWEGTDADLVPAHVSRFEHEFGIDDRSLMTGAANGLAIDSPALAISVADDYADLPQFRRYWAAMSVIAQFDAFPYSLPGDDYFLYADPTTGRLQFLPWGMDESFMAGDVDVTQVSSVLATKCKEATACFQAYVDEAWAALAAMEAMNMIAERERVAAQIAPYVALDARKPYTNAQVTAAQSDLHWFFAGRRARFEQWLPPASNP